MGYRGAAWLYREYTRSQGLYNMGCSQNHGPLWVVDYFTAPNIQGYQSGIEILRITHRGGI